MSINFLTLSEELDSILTDGIFYLHVDKNLNDFTKIHDANLIVQSKTKTLTIKLSDQDRINPKLHSIFSLLIKTIFTKTVITWDIKQFFSYIKFHYLNIKFELNHFIDLKYLENFHGLDNSKPQNLQESIQRLKPYVKSLPYHKRIHFPLMTKVLPSIETNGIMKLDNEYSYYFHYEIEGQNNGRLGCNSIADNFINIFTISNELKDNLKMKGILKPFYAILDYSAMEVSVLAWLSSDPILGNILDSKKDTYKEIYEILFNENCSDEKRDKIKSIFLPVYFGMTSFGISERLDISQSEAEEIHKNICDKFEISMKWIVAKEDELKTTSVAKDYFGRERDFSQILPYKVRNFHVQAVASTICLDKTIALFDKIGNNLLFFVHDGFFVGAQKKLLLDIVKSAMQVLQEENEWYKGLKLKVNYKFGKNLGM